MSTRRAGLTFEEMMQESTREDKNKMVTSERKTPKTIESKESEKQKVRVANESKSN